MFCRVKHASLTHHVVNYAAERFYNDWSHIAKSLLIFNPSENFTNETIASC
jgi:hypothetical protein